MKAALLDTRRAALYAEGHRHGLAIVRQHGLAHARKTLWALHHSCRPTNEEAGEYAHGVIDALETAICGGVVVVMTINPFTRSSPDPHEWRPRPAMIFSNPDNWCARDADQSRCVRK